MKTLEDVKLDMSELYEQVKSGDTDLKMASELANITGKYLKAVQLDLAQQIFLASQKAHSADLANQLQDARQRAVANAV